MCSAHRQFHPYGFLSIVLLFSNWYELPFLVLSSITVLGLPGGFLLLQSQAGSDGRDTMLQALRLLLVVDQIDVSTSTHQSTSSLLTLLDQKMLRIFLQSHLSQLSNLCIPSFLSVNDSVPYTCSSVLQMTVFTIHFLRLGLKDFVKSFLFCIYEYSWYILNPTSFLQDLYCVIRLPK